MYRLCASVLTAQRLTEPSRKVSESSPWTMMSMAILKIFNHVERRKGINEWWPQMKIIWLKKLRYAAGREKGEPEKRKRNASQPNDEPSFHFVPSPACIASLTSYLVLDSMLYSRLNTNFLLTTTISWKKFRNSVSHYIHIYVALHTHLCRSAIVCIHLYVALALHRKGASLIHKREREVKEQKDKIRRKSLCAWRSGQTLEKRMA